MEESSDRMANKTTSDPKSQEQSVKAACLQSQLARIKKEEEEEIWISGEELYTEGSSDEEEYKTQSRSRARRKVNSNRSSRASSANPSEQRDNSLLSAGSKAKLDQCTNASKTIINEGQTACENVSKCERISLKNLSLSTMESLPNIDHRLPTVESAVNSCAKDSSDCSLSEEEQIQDTEISWKAHRELYNYEELLEDDWKDDIEISSVGSAEDECVRKEITEMKSLDNLIRAMNDKVKKAIEETLFYQCKNRKRLENILTSSPSETGKLAQNTQQFFHLCPKYSTMNAEFRKDDESLIENADRVNILKLDNEIEWAFVDSTDYIENINDAMEDSYRNPYIVNAEINEDEFLEDEKEGNLCNKEVQLLKVQNDVISTFDTVSTTKSSKDIDRDVINEVIEEAEIVDPSSIVNFAERELDSRNR